MKKTLVAGFLLVAQTVGAIDLGSSEKIPRPWLLGRNGYLSTALSNSRPSSPNEYNDKKIEFHLSDGTVVEGLYFPKKEKSPLLIVSMGLLADYTSGSGRRFLREVILKEKIHASVLMLDDPSGGSFFVRNQSISLGGYDAGQMVTEIAKQMKQNPLVSSIHLMGVSLAGAGMVSALIEDGNNSVHLFESGITFSGVVDYPQSTFDYFLTFNHPIPGKAAHQMGRIVRGILMPKILKHFADVISTRTEQAFSIPKGRVGDFFFDLFSYRLKKLNTEVSKGLIPWNPIIKTDSVVDYLDSNDYRSRMNQISVPLVMIHAKDDPVVPYGPFGQLVESERQNPYVMTLSLTNGGHWGWISALSPDWVASMINRSMEKGFPRAAE